MKRGLCLLAIVLASVFALCLTAGDTKASVGVGVSPGIIRVDEPLLPGAHYTLPSIQVMNTGTEVDNYEVELVPMVGQQELHPPSEFLDISPTSFHLEPGSSQTVSLSLRIPIKAKPGDYLTYVQTHPSFEGGGMSVGVAAVTKLYFTVKPANMLVGVTNAIANFLSDTAPTSYIFLGVVAVVLLVFFLRRHIKVYIKVGRR
jgi:hypothetical protein